MAKTAMSKHRPATEAGISPVKNPRRKSFRSRPVRAPKPTNPLAAPGWVRALVAGGRPIILLVALLMCSPGEYHLARAAGWSDTFSFGMPIVLSAYAGVAAAVASTRRPGDRGRWSAIIGAGLALALASAAQVASHWISTGHLDQDQPALIAVISLVPPFVVGHLLHLASTPPSRVPVSVPEPDVSVPETVAPQPVADAVTLERQDAPDAIETPELLPASEPDADTTPVLLTSGEIAAKFGVTSSTVRSWVADGKLVPVQKDARGHNLFSPDARPAMEAAHA